jgi:hypothetical protein
MERTSSFYVVRPVRSLNFLPPDDRLDWNRPVTALRTIHSRSAEDTLLRSAREDEDPSDDRSMRASIGSVG